MNQYYVYILASKSRVLYAGVTSDLTKRLYEHKTNVKTSFAHKYKTSRLVYCEVTQDIQAAIAREKQIKGWLRAKKIALIEANNPTWADLSSKL